MKKSKGYTRNHKNEDPTSYLSHPEQQKNMLLDLVDDEMERKKIKKINKFVEPQLNKDLDHIADSRLRHEALRHKRKPPEFFEKNNSNVDSGLAGILSVNKRLKGKD